MLFLKKKRGSVAPLMLAFEVLVAFFVMTTLIQVSKGYAEQGFYRKAYIAKDISMIADASFAYDGNVEAIYPVETKNYFIDLNENQVKVYTEKEREQAKIGYSFVKPVNIFIEGQILKNPPKIEAVRSGNRFSLNKKQSINLLDCSQLDTSGRIEEKKIMIDSSHGYTDFGNQRTILKDSNIVELKESEINKQIALAVTIPKILYTYDVSRELSQELTLADRLKIVQQQNPNILITIHVGSYSSEQNKITAYISKTSKHREKSKKMGCLIINNFLSDEEMGNLFTGSSIIEVDKESHEHLLDDDRISVILEIGNLQNSDGIELLGKTSEIGDSIKHGIEDYYKK